VDIAQQINQHAYLYLTEISEPEDNTLRLVIEEARASEITEDLRVGDVVLPDAREIVSDSRCFAYELVFGFYVAYSVRNESYTAGNENEEYKGRLFRIYSKSPFLDYVRSATFASDEYPGKLSHYGFICENHIIDVVIAGEPEVKVTRQPQSVG